MDILEQIKVYEWKPEQNRHVELTALADKERLVYQKYGAGFRLAEELVTLQAGQKVYRLVELWEKTGDAALISQVLDEDGNPIANVDVAFYWPDAPNPPDPPTTVTAHDWHPNFVHGPTNVNGDIGPGMGKGAYHGEGEGGPHAVWVRDPNVPSDICEKLGMLAGTFHDHLNQKFRLMEVGEEPSQPPETPPGSGTAGRVAAVLQARAADLHQAADELEAAAQDLLTADQLADQLADLL